MLKFFVYFVGGGGWETNIFFPGWPIPLQAFVRHRKSLSKHRGDRSDVITFLSYHELQIGHRRHCSGRTGMVGQTR